MRAKEADVIPGCTGADLYEQLGTALDTGGTACLDAFSGKGHAFHLLSQNDFDKLEGVGAIKNSERYDPSSSLIGPKTDKSGWEKTSRPRWYIILENLNIT